MRRELGRVGGGLKGRLMWCEIRSLDGGHWECVEDTLIRKLYSGCSGSFHSRTMIRFGIRKTWESGWNEGRCDPEGLLRPCNAGPRVDRV